MIFPEYESYDAVELAALIRSGEIAETLAVEAAIERIEAWNPRINAVVRKMYNEAGRRMDAGLPKGPFTGVPFLLKDLAAHYRGVPTGTGSALFQRVPAADHSPLTRRYLDAGLVILGKTNTPELGISGTTEPSAGGMTRNPRDLTRSPGGSSGGSAAAVAAGMVPMAHGTDTGGSIRNPAANCGLFGLKPSRGRVPMDTDVSRWDCRMTVMHALTRSVRDSAALLDAVAEPDPARKRPFSEEIRHPPGNLKIALHTQAHHRVEIHPECVRAAEEAAKLCADAGFEVEADRPEISGDAAIEAGVVLWSLGVAETVSRFYREQNRPMDGSGLEWSTRALAQNKNRYTVADGEKAVRTLQKISDEMTRFFSAYDLVLSPVLSTPPWPLGVYENRYTDPQSYVETVFAYSPFCWPYNISGQPAVSVPLHKTESGLPVGVMFAAPRGAEAVLFRLSAFLEHARPWFFQI